MSTTLCLNDKEGSPRRISSSSLLYNEDPRHRGPHFPPLMDSDKLHELHRKSRGYFLDSFHRYYAPPVQASPRDFCVPANSFLRYHDKVKPSPRLPVPSSNFSRKNSRRPPLVPSHYMPPLKIEPEPAVVALDLRICKQNESISLCDFSVDILGEESSSSSLPSEKSPQLSHTAAKRTPSPLPPPSSQAVSMSFAAVSPGRHIYESISSSFMEPLRPTTPFSPFPPVDRLQNLSPLERMKIIGAHHQRFRESLSLKRPRERDSSSSSMDSKIRKIDYLSSETRNLIVLPSRTDDALSSLLEQQQQQRQQCSSPPLPPSFEDDSSSSCPRQILLKRRLSPESLPLHSGSVSTSTSTVTSVTLSISSPVEKKPLIPDDPLVPIGEGGENPPESGGSPLIPKKTKRGRPRKHITKIPLPPLYVFIRNLIHNEAYNPRVISWVNERAGIFKVNRTGELAQTWGKMKRNRSEEMNYEKMSRAMRYHYGNEKQGRKGHLAMVKEKRLVYQFGELAVNWRAHEIPFSKCKQHSLCKGSLCLWSKE